MKPKSSFQTYLESLGRTVQPDVPEELKSVLFLKFGAGWKHEFWVSPFLRAVNTLRDLDRDEERLAQLGAEGKSVEDWKAPYLVNAGRELLQVSINPMLECGTRMLSRDRSISYPRESQQANIALNLALGRLYAIQGVVESPGCSTSRCQARPSSDNHDDFACNLLRNGMGIYAGIQLAAEGDDCDPFGTSTTISAQACAIAGTGSNCKSRTTRFCVDFAQSSRRLSSRFKIFTSTEVR